MPPLSMLRAGINYKEFFSKLKLGDVFTYLPVTLNVEEVIKISDEHGLVVRYFGSETSEYRTYGTDVFRIERRCMPLSRRKDMVHFVGKAVHFLSEGTSIPMSIIDMMKTGALEAIHGINEQAMEHDELVKKVQEAHKYLISVNCVSQEIADLMRDTALRKIVKRS